MQKLCIALISLLFLLANNVNAGIIIGSSRLIYHGDKKESAINIENPDPVPFLIQSWTEDSDGKPIKADNAFIVTPPLFRLDGNQKNLLRIIRTASALPQDRESLFWLNIKSIPSSSREDSNTLQIAVRSRLKLIYRPSPLKNDMPESVTHRLSWKKVGDRLEVTNPTGYYMNFLYIKAGNSKLADGGLVAPYSSASFAGAEKIHSGEISWKIINDYGGFGEVHRATL
ncbi:fimbrial biogenesis chaperone [Erwinia phyllosphaerae]|uniref:fimbrial biogenesis chaperone n=1 Tax=Erwinia phyllosphaerae TaxID=2853256 RepID=UPI001FED5598|nr:molecular chaperone [Erwinia phyllosphaerae]MBV4368513.1 molecular chaperone [Erwinia phyllosphaerae]